LYSWLLAIFILAFTMLDSVPLHIVQLFKPELAWHYKAFPFREENGQYHIYMDMSQIKPSATQDFKAILGKEVVVHPLDTELVREFLVKHYRVQKSNTNNFTDISNGDFVASLILEAHELGSSDIHVEPYEQFGRVRMRVDGQLIERHRVLLDKYPGLVNKIKIKASLDIAEKRLPQDGRIFHRDPRFGKLDVRVSSLPTLHGEKLVLRLLGSDASDLQLERLGMSAKQLADYMEGIKKPTGMMLISGPTGSGKTTTLYATLRILNRDDRNLLTIEDPIEYTLEGVNQVQLKESIGLDFPATMRTFLRQDPDVIMVGEIRDPDTASMAIRASLTGRLVLSTIHTNSAWGIGSRLMDMGVPPYLLSETLNTAVAQRLHRLLCPHCKAPTRLEPNMLPAAARQRCNGQTVYQAQGCEHCFYTGYQGRKAIYEVIPIDIGLAEEIRLRNPNVKQLLKDRGIESLADQAFELIVQGLSSPEETYPTLSTDYA
jgi:general secretion pathway protein E/type IV pilus assembly protein PilB